MNNGWICLWRKLLDDPIYINSTPTQVKILIAMMLLANHETKQWEWQGKKFKVQPGQFVTSLESLAKKCGKGINAGIVRKALIRFEKLGFSTSKGTKTGTLVTIVNWAKYQDKDVKQYKEEYKDSTKTVQRQYKDSTTNNNDNNVNNDNNIFYKPKMTGTINPTPAQFTTPEEAGVQPSEELEQKRQFFTLKIWTKYPEARRGNFEEAFTQFLSALEDDKAKVIADGIKNYVEAKQNEPIKYTAMLANNLNRKDYRNDYSAKKQGRQETLPKWANQEYKPKQLSAAEEERLRKENEELMKQLGV